MKTNEFKVIITNENGEKTIKLPEGFPDNCPQDLHEEDIFNAIRSKLAEKDLKGENILTQEEIHKKVTGDFGSNKMAMWGNHSHGVNSGGAHSHN